jgi:hypothetical protein
MQFGICDPHWRLAQVTLLSQCQPHVWMEHIGDIITQLTQFSLQQYWILLSKWVRNINLHHPLQLNWKTDERKSVLGSLMFVPRTVWLSIIDQHYALSYITPLFDTQAPTCFDIHVPSPGSFSSPRELLVVVPCVMLSIRCAQLDNITHGTTTFSAHKPPTLILYNIQNKHFCFM